MSGSLPAANKAIQLTPNDAEAHFAGAAVLSLSSAPEQTIVELERAVALRPADYSLWLELGLFRDQKGDTTAALSAYDEAVRLAPHYAKPRWNRGNVLLRAGQYEAAFDDLRQAAESNPELVPSLLDLAWGMSKQNSNLTEQLAQVKTEKMRIAFAKFLARQGKAKEAIAQFGAAGNVPDDVQRELVEQLLAKNAFKEAYTVWKVSHGLAADDGRATPSIYDGGFEGLLAFDEGGFGWKVPRILRATTISLDSSHPHSGSKSLRIEFAGNSNSGAVLVSQLIMVEPSRRYRINFAARSQDVVTGGLPMVTVTDATANLKRLGQSSPLSRRNGDWQPFSFEFATSPKTTAVVLNLQREDCTTSPCPIFGAISLDSFSIEQLK